MFDIEILDTCTLQQACEWIAFGWEPMPPKYEAYCNHIRPHNPNDISSLDSFFETPPEPTYKWDKYSGDMHRACSKLTIALLQKEIIAYGNQKAYKKYFPSAEKQAINFGNDDVLDYQHNQIKVELLGEISPNDLLIEENIEINFNQLKRVFPHEGQEQSRKTFKLTYEEDDSVYLYTGNLQKTLIKKFAKNDNKSKEVIKYIMQHPSKLITRDEIIQCGIKGFDKADRIDNILKNAFANLNIYKCFFKSPKTASVEFVEQITTLDIDSAEIDIIVIK